MAAGAPERQVVLVTGCSSGLGRALCFELAKRPDVAVVATARRLDSVAELQEQGVAALALALDVNSEASLKGAMEKAAALGGGAIGAVVCNAGMAAFGPLAVQPINEVQAVMDTNIVGVLRTVQAAVPFMAKPRGRGGRILIVGSVSATLTIPFSGAYSASKAAVQAFADALRMELKPLGISVTNIIAGAFKSNFSSNAESTSDLDAYADGWYASALPAIKMRMWTSQNMAISQPVEQVAETIVRRIFEQGGSPAHLCVGGGFVKALLAGFLQKWLPASLMDGVHARMFGLSKL